MELTKNRLLLYMDISGFKNMIENESLNDVYHKMKGAIIASEVHRNLLSYFNQDEVQFQVFSDSIFIASTYKGSDDIHRFLEVSRNLFERLLRGKLLIKGVITHGEILFDPESNILIGKPIVDAVMLEKELKQFSVVLHSSAEELIKQNGLVDVKSLIETEGFIEGKKCKKFFLEMSSVLFMIEVARRDLSENPRVYCDNTLKAFRTGE